MTKPIRAFINKDNITLMFVDVLTKNSNKLFHQNFYIGAEKSACIDKKNGVFLVAITKKKTGFHSLYEIINDTVEIIRQTLGVDLSAYHQKYLTSEMFEKHFA